MISLLDGSYWISQSWHALERALERAMVRSLSLGQAEHNIIQLDETSSQANGMRDQAIN